MGFPLTDIPFLIFQDFLIIIKQPVTGFQTFISSQLGYRSIGCSVFIGQIEAEVWRERVRMGCAVIMIQASDTLWIPK